jgi:protein-S-isoprenylcysteine O-methyltransferase Ste14
MLLRAILAFLVCPGTVAVLVPLLLIPWNDPGLQFRSLGLPVLVLGFAGLLWCVRDFYVAGKGTLAPWAPPQHLVIVGLYRYSRNPMYVSVLLVLIGWALCFGHRSLWIYALIVAIAFQLRVVFAEEPTLARMHGEEWTGYRQRVRRWF